MRDLNRVQAYINLGYEKEEAMKLVDEEAQKEADSKQPTNDPVDMNEYIPKKEVDEMIKKAVEESKLESKEVEKPKEEKVTIPDLMSKFF